MEKLPLLCIVSLAFTGLTKATGILPNGPLNATVGDTFTFTTTLTPLGKPFVVVTWRYGDKVIFTFNDGHKPEPGYEDRLTYNESTASLELRNVRVSDSGEYTVSATRIGESTKEGTTTLNVYEPVSNVMTAVSSTDLVEFNSSVRLSCSSSGSSLFFLWMNGTSDVTASDRVHLTGGGTNLTIVNVTRNDQGPFRCRVSNPVSFNTSDPINLSISFGPEKVDLQRSPSQHHYEKGLDITLSCSAVSSPSATFSWFLNGEKLSDTGRQLELLNVEMNQTGNYSCQAFNEKTNRYDTSPISVLSILERISSVSITSSTNQLTEGSSVTLTCVADGSVFNQVWVKDGSDLPLSDGKELHFPSLNRTDKGLYSCIVSNPINTEKAQYNMDFQYGPDNVLIEGPTQICPGETLNLTCSAESNPAANYTWKLNGAEIHRSAVFIKLNVKESDSGTYTCEASNAVIEGRPSAEHQLSLKGILVCSPFIIVVIVIACLAIVGAAGGFGYYAYNKRTLKKGSLDSSSSTAMSGEGQDNTTFSGNQDVNYADITIVHNKDTGSVQLRKQNDSSEYAEVKGNKAAAAASPPAYDVHLQRMNMASSQAVDDNMPCYSQIRRK